MMGSMPLKQAILVSFEGPDGVGKSTQVARTKEALEASGKRVAVAKLPAYRTLTGRLIRRMLNNGQALSLPNAFQVVQWIDKAVFQLFTLPRLLRQNDYVLLDRWHASMWAYGLAGGANEWLTNSLVSSVREPHAVLVFHGNCKREGNEDSYEADASLQKSVALHYVLWVCTHGDNSFTIDANGTVEDVTKDVLNTIYSIC